MFQTKAVERTSTHIMFNKIFPKIYTVYEIMWRNMLQPDSSGVPGGGKGVGGSNPPGIPKF
jgi:hypothetical protein